jgi:hypothetical protein
MKRILPRPKNLHRLHIVELEYPKRSWRYVRRQGIAVLCLLGGIALSFPGMPGPGFVLVLLGILLGDYPRKKQFFLWLEHKRSFRQARVYLRRRWNMLLLLGRPWVSEEEKEREKSAALKKTRDQQAEQNAPSAVIHDGTG